MAIQHAWKIDPSQSTIAFKVGFMLLGVVTGEFRRFDGTVLSDDAFEDLDMDLSVDLRSVITFNSRRDEGMLSGDFFDAAVWPVMRFVSTSFRRVSSGGLFELGGLLTIRGVTVPLELMVSLASFGEAGGCTSNGAREVEAVFKFSGSLRRSAFGLGGPATPDQEHVADEVDIFGEARVLRDCH